MFKLVVLIAFLAVAAAEPSSFLYGPAAYSSYSTVLAPATTTISKQASSVVHPSPALYYSSPFAYSHFIKKRSVPFYSTYAYASNPYFSAPYATTYSTPLVASSPILPAAAPLPYVATHLIKKRSAQFLPSIVAPTTYAAASPLLTSTYAAAPLHTPLVSTAPLYSHPIAHPIAYSGHLIKKRSAPLLTAYSALPTSYSTQSRVDYTHSAPFVTTYSSPLVYSSPFAYSHAL